MYRRNNALPPPSLGELIDQLPLDASDATPTTTALIAYSNPNELNMAIASAPSVHARAVQTALRAEEYLPRIQQEADHFEEIVRADAIRRTDELIEEVLVRDAQDQMSIDYEYRDDKVPSPAQLETLFNTPVLNGEAERRTAELWAVYRLKQNKLQEYLLWVKQVQEGLKATESRILLAHQLRAEQNSLSLRDRVLGSMAYGALAGSIAGYGMAEITQGFNDSIATSPNVLTGIAATAATFIGSAVGGAMLSTDKRKAKIAHRRAKARLAANQKMLKNNNNTVVK